MLKIENNSMFLKKKKKYRCWSCSSGLYIFCVSVIRVLFKLYQLETFSKHEISQIQNIFFRFRSVYKYHFSYSCIKPSPNILIYQVYELNNVFYYFPKYNENSELQTIMTWNFPRVQMLDLSGCFYLVWFDDLQLTLWFIWSASLN